MLIEAEGTSRQAREQIIVAIGRQLIFESAHCVAKRTGASAEEQGLSAYGMWVLADRCVFGERQKDLVGLGDGEASLSPTSDFCFSLYLNPNLFEE